ncbi:MAG: glycoside hydrolase family 78 protein [Clostridiales bacterium]|nr:glycoside hydrolase family 78 protein [Clostridiales bacterium]
MEYSYNGFFYKATDSMNTYEKHVNAPYIRKTYDLKNVKKAVLDVSGLGFYDLWFNEKKITKGLLAPYISNPDDIVYFDRYDITDLVKNGPNCIGIILGNGMQNAPGGRVWDFDIARFRNAPCFALVLKAEYEDGTTSEFTADESFKCAPSPIIFDDLRSGCFYDACQEIKGWNSAGFDDSNWAFVKKADMPRGEFRLCEADPIVIETELTPVQIREETLRDKLDNRRNMRLDTQFKFNKRGKKGILFDFGVNRAGIVRLKINGKKGQEIFIQLCEHEMPNGEISYANTGSFYPDGYGQTLYYICKGEENEIFEPAFTYSGFRYAMVFGLEKEQIIPETLTYLVASSHLEERGSFTCSDEIMNKLRDTARISDKANFFYFPTDCPHREKNGWTGDAASSAEHVLLTLTPEKSYREWLRNICAAQRADGALPGIVPTGGWGFEWGNGPAWDNVLTELCWQIYRLRGDLTPAKECADSMLRYLAYISKVRRADGLIAIGLGDWLQPFRGAGDPTAPLVVTDSIISMYIAKKSADLFEKLNLEYHHSFALALYSSLRQSIRDNLIDFATMTVFSRCQTAQAMCIYYGVFEPGEKKAASDVLVDIIHEGNDLIDTGLLGLRVMFHVLSDCGQGELAYKMITRQDTPSYASMLRYGLTSMPENFLSDEDWTNGDINSLNHHFFCDYVSWFIQRIAGVRVNPKGAGPDSFEISPDFISQLTFAQAHYDAPCGRVEVKWQKEDGFITLSINCPEEATGNIVLPRGYFFSKEDTPGHRFDKAGVTALKAGIYKIIHS